MRIMGRRSDSGGRNSRSVQVLDNELGWQRGWSRCIGGAMMSSYFGYPAIRQNLLCLDVQKRSQTALNLSIAMLRTNKGL